MADTEEIGDTEEKRYLIVYSKNIDEVPYKILKEYGGTPNIGRIHIPVYEDSAGQLMLGSLPFDSYRHTTKINNETATLGEWIEAIGAHGGIITHIPSLDADGKLPSKHLPDSFSVTTPPLP
jgi:hypothetical protein